VSFYAFADFGTRNGDGSFNPRAKDGRAEVVAVGPHLGPTNGINEATGFVGIYTLEGEAVLKLEFAAGGAVCRTGQATGERGGPPTIADFDGDGMPELGVASAYFYRVFDLDCASGCQDASRSIRWAQPSQDCSSGATGSSSFDFDGDGKAEAVYGDECFVRVYDGSTGEALLSEARTSATWWEYPIVADPDHSGHAKIILGNASEAAVYGACNNGTPDRSPVVPALSAYNGMVDRIYKGLRCETNDDCPTPNCVAGYCRCNLHTSGPPDIECGNTYEASPLDGTATESGFICTTPLPGTPGAGNVCRMQHGNYVTKAVADRDLTGLRAYRDRRDCWRASRPLWNQHAYSITNIMDDGRIPKTLDWRQNFLEAGLNNFRTNR
jgi:hypothetical protein